MNGYVVTNVKTHIVSLTLNIPKEILRPMAETFLEDEDLEFPYLSESWEPQPSNLDLSTSTGGFVPLSEDNLLMKYRGEDALLRPNLSWIQANKPAPRKCFIYYFEINVQDDHVKGKIAIGFTDKTFLFNLLSWRGNLISGYKDFDGIIYSGYEKTSDTTFTSGDVIGAGINYSAQDFFFCKDGVLVHSVSNDLTSCNLYPTIAILSRNEELHINFGKEPFVFDPKDFEARERRKQKREIAKIYLSPKVSYRVVRTYLLQCDYQETFKSFDVPPAYLSEEDDIDEELANALKHRMTLQQECTASTSYGRSTVKSNLEKLLKQLTACRKTLNEYQGGEAFKLERELSRSERG